MTCFDIAELQWSFGVLVGGTANLSHGRQSREIKSSLCKITVGAGFLTTEDVVIAPGKVCGAFLLQDGGKCLEDSSTPGEVLVPITRRRPPSTPCI